MDSLLLVLFQKVIQSSEDFYFYFKSLFNFLLLEAVNYTTVLTSLYRKASPTERKETQIPTGNKRFQQKSSTTIITHGGEQKPHFLDFPCQNTAEFPTPVQLCHRLFWRITSGLIWAQSVCAEPLHPPKLSRSILWDAFELWFSSSLLLSSSRIKASYAVKVQQVSCPALQFPATQTIKILEATAQVLPCADQTSQLKWYQLKDRPSVPLALPVDIPPGPTPLHAAVITRRCWSQQCKKSSRGLE